MSAARRPAGVERLWPTLVSVLLVMAMLVAAMIPWWPIYESAAFVVASSAAIVAGTAIAVAGAKFGWPAWAVVIAVFGTYLVLGVPAAVPSRAVVGVIPTPQGIVELLAGAALSWKQLVTIAVPVGSYQTLLVPPFLLALVAATSAVTIALRSRRPAAAVIPPAVLLLAGIALGVVHAALAIETGLAFLVTAVAWLVRVAIANRRAITSGRPVELALADARRVLGASAIVAVALVGATAASVALPMPPRSVVRAELQPPFEPRAHESPLAGFRTAFDPDGRRGRHAGGARPAPGCRHPHRDPRHLRRDRVHGRRRRRHRRVRTLHPRAVSARPDRRARRARRSSTSSCAGTPTSGCPASGSSSASPSPGSAPNSSPTRSSTTT